MQRQDLVENKFPYNEKFRSFVDFLGLPTEKDGKGSRWPYREATAKKVEDLYMWAKVMSNSVDEGKIRKQIIKLRKAVGVNWIGESLIENLWQHIKFDSQYKPTKRQIEALQKKEKGLDLKEKEYGESVEFEKNEEVKPKEELPAKLSPILQRNVKYRIKPKNEIKITKTRTRVEKPEPLDMNHE